jgi:hypothetical protein
MRGISSFRDSTSNNSSSSGSRKKKKEKEKEKKDSKEHPIASGMVVTQEPSSGGDEIPSPNVDLESVIKEFLARFSKESEDDFKMLNFEFLVSHLALWR